MSEQAVKVTRKGQVTIPSQYRKKFNIREGSKLLVSQDDNLIIMKPVPNIEDLAGIHSGKISLEEMKKELDRMRSIDMY
ncbi:MAG: AbrB/MazE/SpoVT family DNA-binding domain-containing protein [Nitrososphaerota archaeon]|nr:AbrB/MazE/SpoVT family DNA-binding domain-containing protein [Nitrososphaerota archaeon]